MPTILCIDDNASGLATRKAFLERQGYSVLTAEEGITGLSLLLTRYDIKAVVLDHRMPGMDGEAVASIIANERPDLPIVLLSGVPEFLLPRNLLESVDACVTKGESPQTLLTALERITGTNPERPCAKISQAVQKTRQLREQAKAIRSETRSLRERLREQAG